MRRARFNATFAVGLALRPSASGEPTAIDRERDATDLRAFLFLGSQREPVKRFFVNGLSPG